MGDEPRDAILRRRAKFLAAALAGVAASNACGSEVQTPDDTSASATGTTSGQGGAEVCLSAPQTGGGGAEPCLGAPGPGGGGEGGAGGGQGGAGGQGG